MEAPRDDGGAAGFAAGTPVADAAHRGAALLGARSYKGVTQLSPDNFAYTAPVNGRDTLVPGFPSPRAAADSYDTVMRTLQCRVVNTPVSELRRPARRAALPCCVCYTRSLLAAALLAAAAPRPPRGQLPGGAAVRVAP